MFAFFVLAIVGPLLMFTPRMAAAKGKGLAEYGLLAQRYVENFEQKWVCREPFSSEELLGTGDIQSLADLGKLCPCKGYSPCHLDLDDISRLPLLLRHCCFYCLWSFPRKS